ncbi:MAG: hypothetical protein IPM29_09865 [Planctomycetes bacterium]|nr:hypothetical protein [Planctomycetota bacterium]
MANRNLLLSALAATLVSGLSAQTLLIPAAANTGDLPSSTGWPFDLTTPTRTLYIYDSSHFTSAGVTSPILISAVRIRANGNTTATWAGDTIPNVTLDLSTAPTDYSVINGTFDTNHGADRAQVYNAPMVVPPGSSTTGAAGPFAYNMTFSTPFLYDPSSGDLTVDIISGGAPSTANTPTVDASSTTGQALARRVYGLSYAGSPTGTVWSGESAHAIEFTYTIPSGYATAARYGTACGGDAPASFYELFTTTANPFDLSGNAGFTMQWLGGTYRVTPGASPIVPPTGVNRLTFSDDQTQQVPLPFAFPSAAGNNSAVWLCSNGWMAFSATTLTTLTESVSSLLNDPFPRLAFLWDDLAPNNGGTIDAEPDVSGTFHITFTAIPEYSIGGANDVQISLQSNGTIEVKYGTCSTLDCLVGYGRGSGARDPGGLDFSTLAPFTTGTERPNLELGVVDRPVLGTTANTIVRNIAPATALAGAINYGIELAPPLDLTFLGAPGCFANASAFFSQGFSVAAPTATVGIPLPNLPSLAGIVLDQQALVADPSVNRLGVATTNGVKWTLDVN